jgi:hypothetical protein
MTTYQPSIGNTAQEPSPTMRNLIVVRAGEESLHSHWIAGREAPQFDLAISYYGDEPQKYRQQAGPLYEHVKGGKWNVVHSLIRRNRELISSYDCVAIPDDDMDADAFTWNRLFEIVHNYKLDLAQPALTADSPTIWDFLWQHPGKLLRFTNFVEVMTPIFSRRALPVVTWTFGELPSGSGWGLDYIWSRLLYWPEYRKAVIDKYPARHTRPCARGDMARFLQKTAFNPFEEMRQFIAKYRLDVNVHHDHCEEYGFIADRPKTE